MRSRSTPPRPAPLSAFAVALVALSCAALGCAEDLAATSAAVQFDACQSLALAADDAATADQLQAIQDAADLWNQTGATRLALRGAQTKAADANVSPSVPIHFQRAAPPFHGFYDDQTVQIFINQDLIDHPRVVTIAHEVGHALGLVHVAPRERASLMNSGNLTIDPTPGDVAALATRWGSCVSAPGPSPTATSTTSSSAAP